MHCKKKLLFWFLVLSLPACLGLLMPVNAASSCTINYTTTYQKIDGFGCTTAFHAARNLMNFSEPARTKICDLLWSSTSGIGLSILRNMVGDSGTWGSNIDGPNPSIEPSEGVWNWTGDEDQIWAMGQAQSRGCTTFMSTVWSPPAWMKDNGSVINGGHLRADKYQQFADYLAEYVNGYQSHHNITISGISVSNEPNLSTSYSSCLWTSTELKNFIGTNLKSTFAAKNVPAKVIACEHMNFTDSLIAEALNDTNANSRIDIVAAHAYGNSYSPLTTANSKNKTIWMTEWLDQGSLDSTINGGIITVKLLHNHLTNANVSAWLYMYGPGKSPTSNSSLICLNLTDNNSYEVRKRLWTIGNYSRYIRPGSTRIAATASPASNVLVSAFKDPSGKLVVVAINDNSSTSDITFTLQGYTTSAVTPYRTSATEDLTQLSAISASSGSFTATLAAKSVTTFVAGGTVITPTPTTPVTPTPTIRTATPTPTQRLNVTPTPTPTSGPTPTRPPAGTGAWLESGGKVAIEAEKTLENSTFAYITTRSSHTWSSVTGSSGNALECSPDNGSYWTDTAVVNTNNPEFVLRIKFATAGNYNVWILFKAVDASEDSIHVGLDDAFKHTKDLTEGGSWKWEKTGTISSIAAGYHDLNLWAREDALVVDKIYLTTGTDTPSGTGPAESMRE